MNKKRIRSHKMPNFHMVKPGDSVTVTLLKDRSGGIEPHYGQYKRGKTPYISEVSSCPWCEAEEASDAIESRFDILDIR
jgi:hypothetical protein